MTSLITAQPDHTYLYIVDLKGGLEFGPYQNLKQVESIAEKPIQAFQVLNTILEKMEENVLYEGKTLYKRCRNKYKRASFHYS